MATNKKENYVEGVDCIDEIVKYDDSSDTNTDEVASTNFGPIGNRGNGLKKVECTICYKDMRSDNLKRHMTQHSDLMLMNEEEACLEIQLQKEVYEEGEKTVNARKDCVGFGSTASLHRTRCEITWYKVFIIYKLCGYRTKSGFRAKRIS